MTRHGSSSLQSLDSLLSGENRVLIAAAYEGVLCPSANPPWDECVAPAMLEILRELAESPRAVLAIVSGRPHGDLARRLRLPAILAGNDGLEIRGPNIDFAHPEARRLRPQLESACNDVGAAISRWRAAWVEDKGLSATVHYRNVDPREQHQVVLAIRKSVSPYGGSLGMRSGNKCMEIHPRVHWDRGSALNYIKVKTGISAPCISIGADRADEAMFAANRNGFNLRVGRASDRAAMFVADASEAALLLARVLDAVGVRQASGGGGLLRAACV